MDSPSILFPACCRVRVGLTCSMAGQRSSCPPWCHVASAMQTFGKMPLTEVHAAHGRWLKVGYHLQCYSCVRYIAVNLQKSLSGCADLELHSSLMGVDVLTV